MKLQVLYCLMRVEEWHPQEQAGGRVWQGWLGPASLGWLSLEC